MPKLDVMLWNKDKTESVRASKIRSFSVYPQTDIISSIPFKTRTTYILRGWYNANEYFYFGWWDTKEEAQAYLEGLHKQIEGR